MKRFYTITLAIILLMTMITPCFAAVNNTTPITPRYMCIQTNTVSFSINQNTNVTTTSAYCCTYENYEIQMSCKLQRYNNSKWNTIKTWTTSGMQDVSLTKNWAVASGYTYRAYVTFYVYDSDGFLLESASGSKSAYFPAN